MKNLALMIGWMAAVALAPVVAQPAEDQPRAARSVHLWFPAPDAAVFYNEMTVEESVPGSYFMACGFRHGYFGIQERGPGRSKVALFSVWDASEGDDPQSVPEDRRVEVLHEGEGVRIGRFGGEGTGAQCFFEHPWEIGETYRFLVKAKVEGDTTAYSGYFYLNDAEEWKHLATFRTVTGGEPLQGLYSFVEDFRRDGESVHQRRAARFGNGWVRATNGRWTALTRARFTADGTPLENINAGAENGRFHLATGGDTRNQTPLNSTILRTPADLTDLPE